MNLSAHRSLLLERVVAFSLAAALVAGCAASSGTKGRLADGSTIPAGASFAPPEPTSKLPTDLLGRIGSSGIRGVFRAELVVTDAGVVSEVRVTQSLGEAVDAELVSALRRLTFAPATLDGSPVSAIHVARVDFTSR